jgi:hypothetical protein
VKARALSLIAVAALLALPGRAAAQGLAAADWTSVSANVARGTVAGVAVTLAGSHVWDPPVSELSGGSTFFSDPAFFTPALPLSDHIQVSGYLAYANTLSFATPVTDPVLHIASLESTLEFAPETQIVRVSGSPGFTVTGNTVTGTLRKPEDGTIRVLGTVGSISFTATTLYVPPVEDGVVLQTLAAPPPPRQPDGPGGGSPTAPDADGDGIPDATDLCPAVFDPGQGDRDQDRIGDACDQLPPGDVPPAAGTSAVVKDVRGEVFVKLPSRRPKQAAEFVPLKGVASLPMGTTVDARKGSLVMVAAANSRPVADRRRRTQEARLRAGIFRIRQARARRVSSRPLAADVVLASAPGAERACAGSTRARPLDRPVRSVSVRAKGNFRAVGGASVSTARNGTWITTDRCDGTLTEVGRGTVTVRDPLRHRTYKVRKGRGLLIRKALFVPLKGRAPR